jgi:histidine triad (HIT) family protein
MTDECVFCKIVKGEIPAAKIFENEKFLAFLDINPANFGHAIIIPKEHTESMISAKSAILKEILPLAKKIAQAITLNRRAQGFNVCINNSKAAGQLVPHLHAHIIPRYDADSLTIDKQKTKRYLPGEMEKIASELSRLLNTQE